MTEEAPGTVELFMKKGGRNGDPLPTLSNLKLILTCHEQWLGVLRFNEMGRCEEYWPTHGGDPLGVSGTLPEAITDVLVSRVQLWLEENYDWAGRPPGRDMTMQAIEVACDAHRYHPVRQWLDSLDWDGIERLDDWLADFCNVEKTAYTMAVGRCTFISGAARVYRPGCKVDTCTVLVGPQGVKKSTLVRLMGRKRRWVSDTPFDIGHKDAYMSIQGVWIAELPELAGYIGKESERLKAFFSSSHDRYRPSHARKTIVAPRGNIFIGTTNSHDFLRDQSGSRRFLCVEIQDIDTEAFAASVEQLWAEAVARFRRGEQWWLTEAEALEHTKYARRFEAQEPWHDRIVALIADKDRIHTSTIFDHLDIATEKQSPQFAGRIARLMTERLGWSQGNIRINGVKRRGYVKPGHREE